LSEVGGTAANRDQWQTLVLVVFLNIRVLLKLIVFSVLFRIEIFYRRIFYLRVTAINEGLSLCRACPVIRLHSG
jgi:hypothetical protein